jgi:hypothetical protein
VAKKKKETKERDARSLVQGTDFHDTVGINLECDFDLRNTTRSGWDTGELEASKEVVILGHRTFTFVYLDHNCKMSERQSAYTEKRRRKNVPVG